jgi:hypothetical protein
MLGNGGPWGNGDSYKVERPELPAYGAVLVVRPPWFRVGP